LRLTRRIADAAALTRALCGVALVLGLAAASAPSDAPPDWIYPIAKAAPAPIAKVDRTVRLPGVSVHFKLSETTDRFRAVDWRPKIHPQMPAVVARGRPPHVLACGYCHLPAGEGRPENAALAGLPREYIIREVHRFATGERAAGPGGWIPGALMVKTAQGATPAEIAAAADYFSRLAFTSRVRVIEVRSAARPRAENFLLVSTPGGPTEPLGQRIVEGPSSMQRFERRDSWIDYTALVPPGSLKRGAGLKGGGVGPPLAGRSPTYLLRQLLAFRSGARGGADAAPMKSVAAVLSPPDMIALAAYAGSLRP
jgi:cytochrome c553